MSYIQAENLVKRYGSGEATVEAVRGMSFSIEQGEFVAVMGASGSGKSTLLSIMGALNTPSEGSYVVDDIAIYELGADRRADFRREYLGFIFQNFHLVPYLNLAENVMLPLAIKKMSGKEKYSMAEEALERVGLAGKSKRLPSQVSGGEQERTAIARAVVNHPSILLADEPTGNLDAATSREVMELLIRLGTEGTTIIMVTHSAENAAYAPRLLKVSDGRLTDGGRKTVLRAAV
jgi:putative ABC transport system ATP-binding protein